MRLGLDSHSFYEMRDLSLGNLAQFEGVLRRAKVMPKIEYFFFRDEQPIPVLEACSGELLFITTVAFISANIQPDCIIVINEPETSLHPTWQQSYIEKLLDLFHYFEPRIFISTHSPIIISGAESANEGVSVYEMKERNLHPFDHTSFGLEEMYDRLFGIITPKNHYLSQCAVELLNKLSSGVINLDKALSKLNELREKSYDKSQQEVIGKIEEMARMIDGSCR